MLACQVHQPFKHFRIKRAQFGPTHAGRLHEPGIKQVGHAVELLLSGLIHDGIEQIQFDKFMRLHVVRPGAGKARHLPIVKTGQVGQAITSDDPACAGDQCILCHVCFLFVGPSLVV